MKMWDTFERRNVYISFELQFGIVSGCYVYECLANGWKFWWHIKQDKIQNEYHYNNSGSYYSSSCVFQEWKHCALHYFTSFSVYMDFSARNSWIIQELGSIHNRTDFNLNFRIKKYANKCVFTYYFSLLALKKCIQIYWAAIAAIKYHTVTHIHTPDAICRSVFFSLKNMHSIFNIFFYIVSFYLNTIYTDANRHMWI